MDTTVPSTPQSVPEIPIAPPRVTPTPPTSPTPVGGRVWKQGNVLVLEPGTTPALLPDRCIKCNTPADGYRLKANLSWHHPALYLIALAGLIIYVVVAMIVRRTAKVEIPLCPRHRAKRRNTILVGVGMLLASFLCFGVSIAQENGWFALAGLVTFVASLVVMIVGAQVVTPTLIDYRGEVRLKGAKPRFLESIPERGPA